MNLEKLFSLQGELDKHIAKEHDLSGVNLFDKKLLALLVELGEFANETRCFKFWSKKGPSERSVMLEEYVDGLHFILSLGLIKNYEYITIDCSTSRFEDGTLGFLDLYKKAIYFKDNQSKEAYMDLFQSFIDLGSFFGFTSSDIENAYLDKNKENHRRQENGY